MNSLVKIPLKPLLNGKFQFTPLGLLISEDVSYEDWEEVGRTLQKFDNAIQFAIGDWIIFGDRKYGEIYAQAIEETELRYQTLMNYVFVSKSIEISRRREILTFSHHSEVASLDQYNQDKFLQLAIDNVWSVRELRNRVQAFKTGIINSSETNEWYTPIEYIQAARKVLGQIDIDPASNEYAQQVIKAKTYYTVETNGLDKEWRGKCWLNPPYGDLCPRFVARLLEQYNAGHVTEAILLVNSHAVETNWFSPLWNYLLCFTDHRINFINPEGAKNGSTHGSAFIYLGNNEKRFYQEFKSFGYIVRRVSYDEHS